MVSFPRVPADAMWLLMGPQHRVDICKLESPKP